MTRYNKYGSLDSPIETVYDRGFSKFNDRFRADQLDEGTLAYSQNGRMEINDEWRVRPGIGVVTNPVTSGPLALTLPFYLYQEQQAEVSVSENTLTLTLAENLYVTDTLIWIGSIDGISYPSPIGNQRIKSINTSSGCQLEVDVAQKIQTSGTVGTSVRVTMPVAEADQVNYLQGSAPYSNPNADNSTYAILAATREAFVFDLEPGSSKKPDKLEYPLRDEGQAIDSKVEITETVEVLQAFNQVFIFRGGKTALVWKGDFKKSFQYVAQGSASQPVLLDEQDNSSCKSGLVSVYQPGHGLRKGDTVVVVDPGSSPFKEREEFEVAHLGTKENPNPDDYFQFYATVKNFLDVTVGYSRPQSKGLGFIHMPAPRFATYHNRRLWMPFEYIPETDGNGDPVIKPRVDENGNQITDALIASDILDPNRYDQLGNQFRVNAGRADYIVGLLSFTDDKIIVFNRNSVHSINNTLDLEQASVDLLTGEVGCCARRSIVQVGSTIFFLSDNGIYGLSYPDFVTLRGDTLPLSEPIQTTIQKINKDQRHKAIGVYFENRIYFAVPLGETRGNNAIIVFDFLNRGWESVDTISLTGGANEFLIEDMFVAGDGTNRAIYIANQDGALHKLSAHDDGKDRLVSYVGQTEPKQYPIEGIARTRMYGFGATERAKFMSYDLHVQGGDNGPADISVTGITENLDGTQVYEIEGPEDAEAMRGAAIPQREDVSIRRRIGNRRGVGFQLEIRNTQGAPRLRAVRINGIIGFRSQMDAK